MKKLFFSLSVLLSLTAKAQTISINYEVKVNTYTYITSTKSVYSYISSNNKSAYFNDGENIDIFPNIEWSAEIIREKDGYKTVLLDDEHKASVRQDYFYKDYTLDTLIFNELMFSRKVIIGESLRLFEWNIVPDADSVILNYNCHKAICLFRGREYVAYFSEEIANYGGPWKFDGLPGLILSVKSKDDYFIIDPIKISILPEKIDIKNLYLKQTGIISWDEYKITIYDKTVKALKSVKADSEFSGSAKIIITNRIEDLDFQELSTDDM